MSVGLESPRPQDKKPTTTPTGAGHCPCCAGPLIPLRGSVRCGRCHYTFCVGCESDGSESSGEQGY